MLSKVTVGLCVKNSGPIVKTALDSISKQDYPHESLKLVIVDEEKNGNIPPILTHFSKKIDIETKLFLVQNKGLGAARQIVIDNAEGDYVVWVDDDFILEKDFVRRHVEFMDQNPQVGAALAKENAIRTTIVTILEGYLQLIGNVNFQTDALGGFEIFRLKAIKQVDGFDTRIKGAAEDRDISIRIKNAGWHLAVNTAAQYYRKYPPTNMVALWRKHFWYGYGQHFLFHKYRNQRLRWELFFPSAFWIGIRDSLKVYRLTHERQAFFLALHYFYRNSASFFGFFCANIDGYGHEISE